ncbi:armadillo-type protein [Dunaliella salina]|uniref:Armadillo-type protein n=1 Tax=Dunaliella salina TaxID=3046 RepID=A0ABQ7GBS1_DUNSA|nr:armadillo-type protein [Dunaliella salina]|eukprot:KAF5832053.1 armadillo-type protein [Dunaliella salina]
MQYVSELASAVAEAPQKTSEVAGALEVAAFLHQRYADFAPQFAVALARAFAVTKAPSTAEEERVLGRRRRCCLRLAGEAAVAGITGKDSSHIAAMAQELASVKWVRDVDASASSTSLLAALVKPPVREALLRLPSDQISFPVPDSLLQQDADLSQQPPDVIEGINAVCKEHEALKAEQEQRWQLPEQQAATLLKAVEATVSGCTGALLVQHRALREVESEVTRLANTRGDPPAELSTEYERRRKAYEGLRAAMVSLCEALGRPMPTEVLDAEKEGAADRDGASVTRIGIISGMPDSQNAGADDEGVFDDREARAFYLSMPDIRSQVPPVLLGAAAAKAEASTKAASAAEETKAPAARDSSPPAADSKTQAADSKTQAADSKTQAPDSSAPAADSRTQAADSKAHAPDSSTPATDSKAQGTAPVVVTAEGTDGAGSQGRDGSSGGAGLGEAVEGGTAGAPQALESQDQPEQAVAGSKQEKGRKAAKEGGKQAEAVQEATRKDGAEKGTESGMQKDKEKAVEGEKGEGGVQEEGDKADDEGKDEGGATGSGRAAMDALLAQLPNCISTDLADSIALGFFFSGGSGKGARKRLTRALYEVPRGAGLGALVPYLARVAAIVAQVFPDVASGVVASLEEEFAFLLTKKDAASVTLETRVRVVRYLGELCKFRLYPASALMNCLKGLLDEFSGPNVDAAAALVECAGRFLRRSPESRVRAENLMEVMMRLKGVRHLDNRQAALVEGAFYAATAPKGGVNAARRKRRPPLQEYIRHLIFVELSEQSIADVLKRLLRLPWAECERAIQQCYHQQIRHHRRLADVRLLAELYNYMLCNSGPVFEALHLLLAFGHGSTEEQHTDPPNDYFRIRLILALLEGCGQYFGSGPAGARLDRFLTFFQAYCMAKVQPLPMDVHCDIHDVVGALRPKLKWPSSLEDAIDASRRSSASGGGEVGQEAADSERDSDDEYMRGEDDKQQNGPDPEEEEFLRELAQLAPAAAASSAAAPAGSPAGPGSAAEDGDAGDGSGGKGGTGETAGVRFRMLMKRGDKEDRSRELQLPADTAIAAAVMARREAEAAEREQMKLLTLAANKLFFETHV